jgi:hypothetical protein
MSTAPNESTDQTQSINVASEVASNGSNVSTEMPHVYHAPTSQSSSANISDTEEEAPSSEQTDNGKTATVESDKENNETTKKGEFDNEEKYITRSSFAGVELVLIALYAILRKKKRGE